ncbi:MAG: ComF family protein [Chloroflexota bacterium]|nr:ComF family protein [Chloroflexota bacterium]
MELLLPPACAGCGRYGAVLCVTCVAGMRSARAPDDHFSSADPGIVVGEALEVAVAAFVHEGATRRALQRLKYGGAAALAAPLAERAMPALGDLLAMVDGDVALVPVPVHPERQRQRGYNQAALLARVLASRVGLPLRDVLVRTRPTARQHGLSRAARLHNLRGAFGLAECVPPGSAAVLVDDILTTSATLEACAEVLRAGGAARVVGFAIAREV